MPVPRDNPRRPVTLASIGREAGVTATTVSLALRNHPRLSRMTVERVQRTAARLGYRMNPYVSVLVRARGKRAASGAVIAVVSAHPQPDLWLTSRSPTVQDIRSGIREAAIAKGYTAQEFWLHRNNLSPEQFGRMLLVRGIRGLVLVGFAEPAAPKLPWHEFSAVTIGRPIGPMAIPIVSSDYHHASVTAVERCYQLGYRRPGFVVERRHGERLQRRWEAGFISAQHAFPDLAVTTPLHLTDWSDVGTFARWYRSQQPDVIIGHGEMIEPLLLQSVRQKAPEDVGLISLSCPGVGQRMSGMYQQGRLVGRSAVDFLVSMMENNERGVPSRQLTLTIPGTWNPGTTLRTR